MCKILLSGQRKGALPCAAIVFYRSATQSWGNMEFCREQTQKECVHLYYSQTSTKIICLMSQLLRAVSLFKKASFFEYLLATLVWNYTACPWICFSSLRERRLFPNYCASRGGGGGLERGSTVQIILITISDTQENTRSTWLYARSVYEFGCHAHVHWNLLVGTKPKRTKFKAKPYINNE